MPSQTGAIFVGTYVMETNMKRRKQQWMWVRKTGKLAQGSIYERSKHKGNQEKKFFGNTK